MRRGRVRRWWNSIALRPKVDQADGFDTGRLHVVELANALGFAQQVRVELVEAVAPGAAVACAEWSVVVAVVVVGCVPCAVAVAPRSHALAKAKMVRIPKVRTAVMEEAPFESSRLFE